MPHQQSNETAVYVVLSVLLITSIFAAWSFSSYVSCKDQQKSEAQISSQLQSFDVKISDLTEKVKAIQEIQLNQSYSAGYLAEINTQLSDMSNNLVLLNNKIESQSSQTNFNLVIGALFGSIFGSLLTVFLVFQLKK